MNAAHLAAINAAAAASNAAQAAMLSGNLAMNDEQPKNYGFVILAIVAFLFFNKTPQPLPTPEPTPIVVPTPSPWPAPFPNPTPSVADYSRVTALLSGKPQEAALLRDLYAGIADVIQRDETIIKSTADVRTLNARAGQLLGQRTSLAANTSGLGAAVDAVIAAELGLSAVPLDAAKRAKAVQTFQQLSAACGSAH